MYSEQIEELIDAILEDGQITEKERSVLHKRAIAEGIDPDEVDVIIDARLAKMRMAQQQVPPAVPPIHRENSTNVKYGEVRKCPYCGTTINDIAFKCEECGHVFVGVGANSSREKLSQIIQNITERHSQKSPLSKFWNYSEDEEISKAIVNFPVPNTKEDLLEFTIFLQPLATVKFFSNSYDPDLTPAYKAKYKECVAKAKIFFRDDPQFQELLGIKPK